MRDDIQVLTWMVFFIHVHLKTIFSTTMKVQIKILSILLYPLLFLLALVCVLSINQLGILEIIIMLSSSYLIVLAIGYMTPPFLTWKFMNWGSVISFLNYNPPPIVAIFFIFALYFI